MGKKNITISIDNAIHEETKKLNLNISQTIEDFLSTLINRKITSTEKINVQLIKMEKKEVEKELSHHAGQLAELTLQIEQFEEQQNKDKIKELEAEKEEIEKNKRCINCGSVFGLDYKGWNNFKAGHVCRGCFLTANKSNLDKWSA